MWASLGVVVAVVLAAAFALPAATPPIRDVDGARVPGSVAALEPVEVNGSEQWLVLRGRDRTNPVLLFVHGGPGTPDGVWLAHYTMPWRTTSWSSPGSSAGQASRMRPAAPTRRR